MVNNLMIPRGTITLLLYPNFDFLFSSFLTRSQWRLEEKLQSIMAKRELSTTLRNLKFMQRGVQREEPKKEEEEVKPVGSFFSPSTISRKCVVVMEGDPHPGATKGRMSFQSFNPSIDKLNEEATNFKQSGATPSGNQNGKVSSRETGSTLDEAECSNADKMDCDEANGDLKRKQAEIVTEAPYPNKSPKNSNADQQPSPNNNKRSRKKKQNRPDWNILRKSRA